MTTIEQRDSSNDKRWDTAVEGGAAFVRTGNHGQGLRAAADVTTVAGIREFSAWLLKVADQIELGDERNVTIRLVGGPHYHSGMTVQYDPVTRVVWSATELAIAEGAYVVDADSVATGKAKWVAKEKEGA